MLSRFLKLAALSTLAASAAFSPASAQVTFLDHRGKAVELDSPPKRLLSIVPSGSIIYYGVDEGPEHIVGVNEGLISTELAPFPSQDPDGDGFWEPGAYSEGP